MRGSLSSENFVSYTVFFFKKPSFQLCCPRAISRRHRHVEYASETFPL
jgi:hypothetical protein